MKTIIALDWPYSRATLELARARKKQQKVDKALENKPHAHDSIKVEDVDPDELMVGPRNDEPIAESQAVTNRSEMLSLGAS